MIIATSTQRAIGLVILAIVVVGVLAYLLFNLLSGRREIGSEIELAPNRKPYYGDDVLETTKLDRSLSFGLVTLGVIGVALPLYWLAEPGRQEGAIETFDNVFTSRGAAQFEEACASCHGPGGTGGVASYTITDESGAFLAQVEWNAPGLTTVLSRFSEDEVKHIIDHGRGVMPAWGAPGGGPLTTQQVDDLVYYLRSIQVTDPEVVAQEVMAGVEQQAIQWLLENDDSLAGDYADAVEALAEAEAAEDDDAIAEAQAEITALRERAAQMAPALVERISAVDASDDDRILYGQFLFNNEAGQGQYNCARCHTNGWSYGARSQLSTEQLLEEWPRLAESGYLREYRPGAGAFGPSLWTIEERYPTVQGHVEFVTVGGGFGPQDSNQMPGFGGREDPDLEDEDGNPLQYPALLTPEQIEAVVAYERSLGE